MSSAIEDLFRPTKPSLDEQIAAEIDRHRNMPLAERLIGPKAAAAIRDALAQIREGLQG